MSGPTGMTASTEYASAPHVNPDILERILTFTDPEDLACSGLVVSRQWRDLILHSEAVWSQHLDPALTALHRGLRRAPATTAIPIHPASKPFLDLPAIAIRPTHIEGTSLPRLWLAVHARNFLRNPTFSGALNWTASIRKSRRPWVVKDARTEPVFENPPVGVLLEASQYFPPLPRPYPSPNGAFKRVLQRLVEPEQPGCLATNREWVEVMQVINFEEELVGRGLGTEMHAVLDSGMALALSLHVAAHHSHAATFAVGVMLDDGKGRVPSMQSFVSRPSSHHFWSGKKYVHAGSGWMRFAYLVPKCPPGFRRAVILLRGRQASPSADQGPYGIKFASAELQFLPRQYVDSFKANVDSPKWRKPTVVHA